MDKTDALAEHLALFNLLDSAVIATDFDYRVIFWNKAAEKIYGIKASEAIGGLIENLFVSVPPIPKQEITDSIQTQGYWQGEVFHSSEKVKNIYVDWTIKQLALPELGFVGAIGIARDLSDRKQAEDALIQSQSQLLLAQYITRLGNFTWDIETGEASWSDGMYRLLKYDRDEKIDFSKVNQNIHHPEDLERVTKWLMAGVASGKEHLEPNEYRLVCQDGEVIFVHTEGQFEIKDGKAVKLFGICQDITERKQVEQDLLKEKQLSEEYINSLPGLFYVFDEERFVKWNIGWETLSGYSSAELENMYATDFFEGTDQAHIAERMMTVFSGEEATAEAELILKDGQKIPYYFTGKRMMLDGKPQLVGLGIDITDRRQAEMALKKSQQQYELISDNINDAIWLFDIPTQKTTFCTSSVERISGFTAEETKAAPLEKLYPPESLALIMDYVAEGLSDAQKQGDITRRIELPAYHKNGSIIWVEISARLIWDENGNPSRILGVSRDISDRWEQERRFKVIAEASADIIYEWDVKTDELLWLGDIDSELGYEKGEIPRSIEGWVKMIHPEDLQMLGDAVEHHRTSTEPIHYTYRVKRKDGTWRYWNDRGYPILGSDNLPKKWIGACTDVTKQKSIENQLLQSQKMEAVGRLAGGVAHDFNNILTGINGYAEIILDGLKPGDTLKDEIKEILSAGKRAAELTNQLLAFSRKQIIAPKIIDLNKVIATLQKMIGRLIGEDIELIYVPSDEVGRIKVDPSQLDQILVNLAVNARDALPDGGKLIIETQNITLEKEQAIIDETTVEVSGDYVMLAISDNGSGMDEDTRRHIFEPFYTTKDRDKGTGLGLSTVYGIVTQSNGFINVYSEKGVGTTFKVYFPRIHEQADDLSEMDAKELHGGAETILLVEDEYMVRNLARRILERLGYKVIVAEDGGSAFMHCRRNKESIQLLLTDVIMPNMNGKELYDELRATRSDLKVLFMSGYTENVIAHHGVLEQKTHFIQKPFTVYSLARAVRKALDI